MVKLTIIVFLLFWQLLPGSCDQILKGNLRTVCSGQVFVNNRPSRAIKNETAKADPDQPYTLVRQVFSTGKVRTEGYDTGLFTTAFCKIVR